MVVVLIPTFVALAMRLALRCAKRELVCALLISVPRRRGCVVPLLAVKLVVLVPLTTIVCRMVLGLSASAILRKLAQLWVKSVVPPVVPVELRVEPVLVSTMSA